MALVIFYNLIRAKDKVGIDLSPEQVDRAKVRYPALDVRRMDGETGSLPEGPFDVIVISDTLNYAADVEVLLRRLHACSHPGTRLIINIYNTLWRPLLRGAVARPGGPATGQQLAVAAGRHQPLHACGLGGVQVLRTDPASGASGSGEHILQSLGGAACGMGLPRDISDRSQTQPAAPRTEARIGGDPCAQ